MKYKSIALELLQFKQKEIPLHIENYIHQIINHQEKKNEDITLDLLFLNAFKLKFLKKTANNLHIYLNKNEIPQIELFDILVNKMPLVYYSHLLINMAIVKLIKNSPIVTLIDTGIGRGIQMEKLLMMLNEIPTIKKVVLIGIDGFNESIEFCKQLFAKIQKTLHYQFEFKPILKMIEEVELEDIQTNITHNKPGIIISNNSFSLHHLKLQEQRKKYFRLLSQIPVNHIILTEPSSNHFTSNWKKRTKNAFEHYYHVFKVIELLEVNQKEKNGLKLFFKREIEDIIANTEKLRVEKLELANQWVHYLQMVGYSLENIFELQMPIRFNNIELKLHAFNEVCLEFERYRMINLMYAKLNATNT